MDGLHLQGYGLGQVTELQLLRHRAGLDVKSTGLSMGHQDNAR
jgi:hypothetical protein